MAGLNSVQFDNQGFDMVSAHRHHCMVALNMLQSMNKTNRPSKQEINFMIGW
jgi:pyruvate kinase